MSRNPVQQVYDKIVESRDKAPFIEAHFDPPGGTGIWWFLDVFIGKDRPSSVHLVIQWSAEREGIGVSRITSQTMPFDNSVDAFVPDVDACVRWIFSQLESTNAPS